MNLTQLITWIAVAERLPGEQINLPVAWSDGAVGLAYFTNGEWWVRGRMPVANVTHWASPLLHPAQLQTEQS